VVARAAAQAHEAVRQQDPSLEEVLRLVFDKLRQDGVNSVFGPSEETLGMLVHHAVQGRVRGSVTRVLDRRPIAMHPSGMVSVVLHAFAMEILGGVGGSQGARANESTLVGSPAPSATATGLRLHCTLPGSAAPANAVATTARWRPQDAMSNDPGRRCPRLRVRRLSRKTRAAVGKPPAATTVSPAVSIADSPGADPAPVQQREIPRHPLLLQTTCSWRSIGSVQFPHWLSQPG
jgi:hypothetical protein